MFIDFSGFDSVAFAKFIFLFALAVNTIFALLIVRQVGQMIAVLPTTLSSVVRIISYLYLIACILAILYVLTNL